MDKETTGGSPAAQAPLPPRRAPSGSPLDWGLPAPPDLAAKARWEDAKELMVAQSQSENPPDPKNMSQAEQFLWHQAVGRPQLAAAKAARQAMSPEQKKAADLARRRDTAALKAAAKKQKEADDAAAKAGPSVSAAVFAAQAGFPLPGFDSVTALLAAALPKAQPLRDPHADANRRANAKLVDAVMAAEVLPTLATMSAVNAGPMSDVEMADYWRRIRKQEADAARSENVIEQVPVRVATADELAQQQGERDAKRLHEVISTTHIVMSGPTAGLTRDEASNMATDDIEAIRAIKSNATRNLALLAAAESRHAQPFYQAEFDRQAPALAIEVEAAVLRAHGAAAAVAAPAAAAFATDVAAAVSTAAAPAAAPPDRSAAIPDAVRRRFMKGDNARYHFPDRSPAFVDRGNKLATHGEHPEVIGALVAIAKARGWEHVKVSGTEAFRRAAWLEASQVGVKVDGYTPTTLDREELARSPMSNALAQVAERVRLEPPNPSRRRPAEQAAPAERRPSGPALLTKAASFNNDKPTFVVKKYPDLAPAYGTLAAAALFAAEHLRGNEERFVKVAKEALVAMIERGETVPSPSLRQGSNKVPPQARVRSTEKGGKLQRSR